MIPLPPPPIRGVIADKSGIVATPWLQWFRTMYNSMVAVSGVVPTAVYPLVIWGNLTASGTIASNSFNWFTTVGQTYTLPAAPIDGDMVTLCNVGSDITNIVAANAGQTIMGLTTQVFDFAPGTVTLKYIASLADWRLI